MALTEEDVERLDARAQEVGEKVGRELRFIVARNPEYVGVTADGIMIIGPSRLSELTALDIDLDLDAIERSDRRIIDDEDGDPRLI